LPKRFLSHVLLLERIVALIEAQPPLLNKGMRQITLEINRIKVRSRRFEQIYNFIFMGKSFIEVTSISVSV